MGDVDPWMVVGHSVLVIFTGDATVVLFDFILQTSAGLFCKGEYDRPVLLKVLVVASCMLPSISGAVIRRHWLQLYIQFISPLVAHSSLLAAAVLCLMPYALPSFLRCCSFGSANPLYWVLLTPTTCSLFQALTAPYIQ